VKKKEKREGHLTLPTVSLGREKKETITNTIRPYALKLQRKREKGEGRKGKENDGESVIERKKGKF